MNPIAHPTPRVDAQIGDPFQHHVRAEFARELERELTTAFETYKRELAAEQQLSQQKAQMVLDALRERDEAETQLRAWHSTFGTSQLSHAIAQLESAQSALLAEQAKNQKLRERMDAVMTLLSAGVWFDRDRYSWKIKGSRQNNHEESVETAIEIALK